MKDSNNYMTDSEALEMLRAYLKCQKLQVKGSYEDCKKQLCDNCDLCYAQGNMGEHIKSIEIAIQALEKQILVNYNKIADLLATRRKRGEDNE